MCEADLSSADQVVIFKGDFACLQAINLTAFTTGDLVFRGGKKFLPVGVSSQQMVVRWNSLLSIQPRPFKILRDSFQYVLQKTWMKSELQLRMVGKCK